MSATMRGYTLEALDRTVRRMRDMLDRGCWPSGLELTAEDRRIIGWNLELAERERDERRAEVAHART